MRHLVATTSCTGCTRGCALEPFVRRRQREDAMEHGEPSPKARHGGRPARSARTLGIRHLATRAPTRALAAVLLGLVLLLPAAVLSPNGGGGSAGAGHGGAVHAIELSATTTPTAWGWGNYPGNGTTNSKSPVKASTDSQSSHLPPGATVTQVAAGSNGAALALTSDGIVYAWGNNQYGQDGFATSGSGGTDHLQKATKVKVPGTVTEIAEGSDFGLALNANGNLYAWGYAANGELGDGKLTGNDACATSLRLTGTQCQNTPVQVGLTSLPQGQSVEGLAAEANDGLILTSVGTVYAWGDTTLGELGNGLTGNACSGTCQDVVGTTPATFSLPDGVTVQAVSGGGGFALVRTSAGTVFAWGDNRWGQLGTGGFTGDGCGGTCDTLPVETGIPGSVSGTSVSAGFDHGMAMTSTGTVYAWGDNTAGELGNGTSKRSDLSDVVGLRSDTGTRLRPADRIRDLCGRPIQPGGDPGGGGLCLGLRRRRRTGQRPGHRERLQHQMSGHTDPQQDARGRHLLHLYGHRRRSGPECRHRRSSRAHRRAAVHGAGTTLDVRAGSHGDDPRRLLGRRDPGTRRLDQHAARGHAGRAA